MAKPIIEVRGLNEFRSALRSMNSDLPKSMGLADHLVGEIVATEARARAPRGPHEGGGHVIPIADNIRAGSRTNAVTVTIGGAASPHAVVTEFGGSIPRAGEGGRLRERRGRWFQHNGRVTRIRKRAYLYPAIDATKGRVREIYIKMLDAVVEGFRK